MRNLRFHMLVLYLIIGALAGSLIGELVQWIVPSGLVRDFFIRGVTVGFQPSTLDLHIFTLTFGFSFVLNIAGLIGLLLAVYVLRWYR